MAERFLTFGSRSDDDISVCVFSFILLNLRGLVYMGFWWVGEVVTDFRISRI